MRSHYMLFYSLIVQARNGALQCAAPELQDLYRYLEVEFNPLHLCSAVKPIMLYIASNDDLSMYITQLEDIIIMRVLKQVHSAEPVASPITPVAILGWSYGIAECGLLVSPVFSSHLKCVFSYACHSRVFQHLHNSNKASIAVSCVVIVILVLMLSGSEGSCHCTDTLCICVFNSKPQQCVSSVTVDGRSEY